MKTKNHTYWNEEGKYQREFDLLTKYLMPKSGEAETYHGELIRACNRFIYDYYNNGNCNVADFYREEYRGISGYYFEMYLMLKNVIGNKLADRLENFIMDSAYGQEREDDAPYDDIINAVMEYVMNNEDKPLNQ